jgi:aspartate/methionine/tyrosine aminotransferase
LLFSESAATAIAYDPNAVVVNSFSKYFSMTGWRIGWMVLPNDLLRPIERLAQNLFISPPTLAQLAAVMALESDEELDTNVARYARNRQILLNNLPQAGIDTFAPADGAFYLYADVSGLTEDSQSYCRAMLADTGVASTPGIDFDPKRGNSFVRFSFAGATEEMVEATKRLRDWNR